MSFSFPQENDRNLIHRGQEFCATPPHSCILAPVQNSSAIRLPSFVKLLRAKIPRARLIHRWTDLQAVCSYGFRCPPLKVCDFERSMSAICAESQPQLLCPQAKRAPEHQTEVPGIIFPVQGRPAPRALHKLCSLVAISNFRNLGHPAWASRKESCVSAIETSHEWKLFRRPLQGGLHC